MLGMCLLPGDMARQDAHCLCNLQVSKKTRKEPFPPLGNYSERSLAHDATHVVKGEREYRSIANPDNVVAPEHMVKAYKVCWAARFDYHNPIDGHLPLDIQMQLLQQTISHPTPPSHETGSILASSSLPAAVSYVEAHCT